MREIPKDGKASWEREKRGGGKGEKSHILCGFFPTRLRRARCSRRVRWVLGDSGDVDPFLIGSRTGKATPVHYISCNISQVTSDVGEQRGRPSHCRWDLTLSNLPFIWGHSMAVDRANAKRKST
jgi:hypothetical protein